MNVSLPSIIEDLSVTSVQGQWIQESYAVLFALCSWWPGGSPTWSAGRRT
ncbi:hypothetical protein [Nocardia pseudobrasiliensis]|uniref:Uncharacterized protein n=1 Tax=Nocardia pseudobrasiliensis TaxID=45979 RepID=A0A370IFL3_9NOCA|nr:hypothetical protein [Nocardia pseudobrasiliensis]RDI68244.1 hypothetical protein DFR76_102645 [Nocardia pseudobrasiliensis]